MNVSLCELIQELCSISAPSGNEEAIVSFIKEYLKEYSDLSMEEDLLGNLIVHKKGNTDKTVMLCAHCDEIGLAIKYIDDIGFIRVNAIGGVDVSKYRGCPVIIDHQGQFVNGIIGTPPAHWNKKFDTASGPTLGDIWVDIGVNCKEDAQKYVSIGDTMTFKSHFEVLNEQIIVSKSIDNRVGVAVLLSLIDILSNTKTESNLLFVFTVQEEIGLRGSFVVGYNNNPEICIVLDVTHATDYPSVNKNAFGDIRLGRGPVIPIGSNINRNMQSLFVSASERNCINYQIESIPADSGTELSQLQIIKGGRITGLISIPCRYMHTYVEAASLKDIEGAIEILKECISSNKL